MIMKLRKMIAVFSLLALLASLVWVPQKAEAAVTNEFYSDYTDVAKIYDYDSCPSIQGIAVGSQKIYTVKTGGDDTKAFISMTDKDSGETVKLTNAATGGYIFDYLNHANDMDVWGIDGKSNIFVATTLKGAEAIVRLRRDDTTLTKTAAYHLKCNGEDICSTAMGIMGVSDGKIHFITKWSMQLYTGSVDVNATGNVTVEMTMLCSITKNRAYIQGQYVDLSKFVNQGMGYHDGTLFLPISGDESHLNSSVILVFDLNNINRGDIVYPTEALVFRVDSSDYSALFELESCDICTADNKLYFGVQRRVTTSDTNHDGIAYFDDYTYSRLPVDAKTSEPDSSLPGYTVRYNANGGTGTMADTWVPYGYSTNLRTNSFTRSGYNFAGWTAYRTTQAQWYYTDGSSSGWYKEGSQPSGWTKHVYKDAISVAKTTAVDGDVVMMYAQWTAEDQTFTIRYDANGGEGVMGDTVVTYGVSTPLRNNSYYRNGWDFGGWTAYRTTQDLWYYTNGSKSAWYKEGQQPSGYSKYIYKNAVNVSATSSIDKDVVIMYAQWTAKDKTYTVQYNANGGSGSMEDTVIVYGYSVQTRPNAFQKTGHKFTGWNIYRTSQNQWYYTNGTDSAWYKEGSQPSGYTKKLYADQVSLGKSSAVDGDTVILYAQWTPITYTVRYDANGGSGSMADTQVTYGVSTKLRANTFTRPGYEFLGWYGYRTSENKWLYVSSDGSTDGWYVEGKQPDGYVKDTYKDQTSVARSTTVDGEVIVLYAQWKANGYVATFLDDDGTVLKTEVLSAGTVPTAPADPMKASDGVYKYTFSGWTPAIGAINSDVTYTATYTCEVVPPTVEPITPTEGMLEPYLERVTSAEGLQEGVPYVISDYKDSWLHYVLTAQKAQKDAGDLVHDGLLLSGTPGVDETNLWYIKDGNLVYGSADSEHYLLLSYDSDYRGTAVLGAYDEQKAVYLSYRSGDDFAIRNATAYLNRHGGSATDFVATAYYAVGGSYWHLDQLVRGRIATVALSSSGNATLMGKTIQLTPAVSVDGISAGSYNISWTVDNNAVAKISSDGKLTALKCGQVTVTATLTSVDGHELLIPTTATYTITVEHDYQTSVVQPTCTTKGYTVYTCACGDSYTANEVAALGHSYDTKVIAPTCTKSGYTIYTCHCGDSYIDDAVAAIGHKYNAVITTAPGCESAGTKTFTCQNCGDVYTEPLAATGHNYEITVTVPTCIEEGYTTHRCPCGHSVVTDRVAVLGHSYETVTVDATCTADGSITDTCTTCGDTKVEVIPATGHSYKAVVTAPTCTNVGYTTYICACGDSYVADEVAALGHSYETVTVDATCTADGSITDTCTICGDTKVEVIPATGHSYNAVVTAPNCTEAGYTTYTCACGDSYVADEVAAIGHKYNAVITTAPGCESAGTKTFTCQNCGDVYTEPLAATGHNYEITVTVPTCTEEGYTTHRCACGHSVVTDRVAALGHSYETVTIDATCTTDGSITDTCTTCGDTQVKVIPATGHSYNAVVTAPTCTDKGYTTYTCACGDSYVADEVAALGHSYETVTIDATCTTDGSITDTCTICGDTKVEVIPATGHTYEAIVTAPTCTDKGYTTYTCACGYSYVSDEVAALGHSYETVTVDATCTVDGSITDTCTICGDTKVEVIPATGHSYNAVVTAPTCTEAGYTTYTCACGYSYVSDEVAALGHNYKTVTIDATCTVDGSVTDTCTVCGDTQVEVIPATGHSYNAVVTAPTCTEAGYTTYTCACGYSYVSDEVASLGHNYKTVTIDATCTVDGSVTDTCTVCGDTKVEVIPATGHSYNAVVTAPTCTEAGYTTYTCTCGDSYVADEVAALGHNYKTVTIDATCTVDGSVTDTCTVCGDTQVKVIPATGHSYNTEVTAPTCTEKGYTTYTCACGHSYVADEVAALGHSYKTVTIDATCTVDGSVTDTCTVCGDTQVKVIPATGHSYNTEVTAPTCTEKGYTTYTCACGHSYVADEVAAIGHKYIAVITTAPGCESAGTKTFTCQNCGDVYTEPLAATGHNYEITVTVPTCTEEGYTTHRCPCGHSVVTDRVAALGHSYETVTIDATCTTDGSITDTCTICGDTKVEVIPATGHSYNAVVTAPTCTNVGYTTYTCACGDSYVSDEVAALGHNYKTVTIDATCTTDGSITDTCTTCGDTKVEVIPATGHTYEAVVTAPTCTDKGYTTYTCACGHSYVADEVAALGHSYETVTVDATCTADGSITDTCTTCGDTKVEVIPATGHSYSTEVTAPTCTEAGYTTYTCACGDSYVSDEVTALGHSYETVTVDATCTTDGSITDTCTICGDTKVEVIPATGHSYSTEVTAPTCTEAGYTTYTCACGDSYVSDEVTALGHSYETVTVDATCTTDGSITDTCTICGDTKVEVIPATGHSYSTEVTAPTCTEAGYTTYTCACGDSYVADEVAALGHSFADGICGVCGAEDPDYVKPVVTPTLTLKAPTLEFKDMITVNAMFTAENIDDVVEMGMITYTEKVDEWSVETAKHVIPGTKYDESTGRYIATSQGIHAKYLGDTVYLACYAKLTDGSYVYTKLASYSPVQYAESKLKGTDVELKQLVVAMLNYGAAAQVHFGHNVDNLANATLTAEQIALPEAYRSDMVSTVASPDATKQGIFANNKGFSKRYPSISFEGAFCINYFFTPAYAPVGEITLYYWNAADYEAAEVLTAENASGSLTMELQDNGEYRGDIAGIAAKALGEGVYVAGVYTDGTTTWTSGVLGYSIGAYCSSQATKGGTIADLAMATAVYGYQAKQYFG